VKTVSQQRKPASADGDRFARILDAIDANIAVLDSAGFILGINKGWSEFAASNPLSDGSLPRQVEIGANYLQTCATATGEASENAQLVYEGIQAVIAGNKRSFSHEYPCHSPKKKRWFLMKVKPIARSKPREVVVTHLDITDRYVAEMRLVAKQQELNAALWQLQDMAEKIKASLGGRQFSVPAPAPLSLNDHQLAESERMKSLSNREMEVLSGLVRGERNSAIASRLNLSRKSISTYRARIFEKLKVNSNVQLVALMAGS
jgi:DNA-binding CsgD family transcriptional regulator